MKILMILDGEFPPDLRVENEISALLAEGHEVHLACTTRRNRPEEDRFGKAFIHRKKISTFIYKSSAGCLKLPFYFNFWRKHLSRLFMQYHFDVIHVHDLPLSRLGVEIKKSYKIPLLIDLHENWPGLIKYAPHTRTILGRLVSSDSQWVRYEKEMLELANIVIVVVEEARDRVALLGIDKSKLFIVSNTINFDNFPVCQSKKTETGFSLFYGGGINRHRGLQVVIDAVKLLKKRNISIRFDIAGTGSYMKTLEKKVLELDLISEVIFHGHKPFNEMIELLSKSDAAIIPHLRTENNDATIPHKLFQYMYLEIPVISSDCVPLKRILSETDTGFIYNSNSPGDLAALLEKLYNNRQLLNEKNHNGKNAVLRKYNWSADKERLINAYDNLKELRINH